MSTRTRLFTAMSALGSWGDKIARGCLYFGVGTLSRSEFEALLGRSWSAYARDDDEIRSGLTAWEDKAYRQFVKPGDRLCLVGCGSGRDLLPFVDMGLDVVGVEPSAQPLARLREILAERGQAATLVEAAIQDAELPGLFDAVVFSVNAYGYIVGSARRIAALRKIADHLTPDGRVFVSYPLRHATFANRSIRVARFAGWLTRSDWRSELNDVIHRLEVDGEPGAILYEHVFLHEEVGREAEAAGLRLYARGDDWSIPFSVLGR